MVSSTHQMILPMMLLFFFMLHSSPIGVTVADKVGETWVPSQELDTSIKCGSCPCVNPCAQVIPPPPPPPPPPQTTYCSPLAPPPPRFVYVTGVADGGNLYQADPHDWEFYYGVGERSVAAWWLVWIGFGVGVLLENW